jgi:hypothetical protein
LLFPDNAARIEDKKHTAQYLSAADGSEWHWWDKFLYIPCIHQDISLNEVPAFHEIAAAVLHDEYRERLDRPAIFVIEYSQS